jgi:hypothetical protein
MNNPISGLRAACTKLFKTNFAPPLPFLKLTTTLATRDVFKPRDSAARISEPAASPYKKETL